MAQIRVSKLSNYELEQTRDQEQEWNSIGTAAEPVATVGAWRSLSCETRSILAIETSHLIV